MKRNTIKASFGASKSTTTSNLYQYDYGQILILSGLDLPSSYEVHFSNNQTGEAKTSIGDENGVLIPDEYLLAGTDIYAWLYLHTGDSDGETEYSIRIPVIKRAKPSDDPPTDIEQSAITQAIAKLNQAMEQTAEDVESAAASAQAASESEASAKQWAEHAEEQAGQAGVFAQEAGLSAQAASDSESHAEDFSNQAEEYALNAKNSAEQAENSAETSAEWADKAEQSANKAGYLEIWVDESGHLMWNNVNFNAMDIYLSDDGKLILTEVTTNGN